MPRIAPPVKEMLIQSFTGKSKKFQKESGHILINVYKFCASHSGDHFNMRRIPSLLLADYQSILPLKIVLSVFLKMTGFDL